VGNLVIGKSQKQIPRAARNDKPKKGSIGMSGAKSFRCWDEAVG
jgi:hypothetical protein